MAYVKAIPHYMKRKTQTKLGFSPIVQNIKNLLHAHSLLPTGCFQYSVLVDFSSLVSMHLHSSHEPIQDLEYWFSFHKVFFASKLCTVHWNLLCMGRRDLSIFYPSWHPSTCIIFLLQFKSWILFQISSICWTSPQKTIYSLTRAAWLHRSQPISFKYQLLHSSQPIQVLNT
jgi:hypothetical protein